MSLFSKQNRESSVWKPSGEKVTDSAETWYNICVSKWQMRCFKRNFGEIGSGGPYFCGFRLRVPTSTSLRPSGYGWLKRRNNHVLLLHPSQSFTPRSALHRQHIRSACPPCQAQFRSGIAYVKINTMESRNLYRSWVAFQGQSLRRLPEIWQRACFCRKAFLMRSQFSLLFPVP